MSNIKLIVGLGNPGARYEDTRHNVGAWLVEGLCREVNATLKNEPKFKSLTAQAYIAGIECKLIIPTTYMNVSGEAVASIAKFYKIKPQEILVAHDDLDLPPGTIRLKLDGGHGGHNGLRDIFAKLGTKQFYRLRIGIGHPGHKDDVSDFVLTKPSVADKNLIINSIHEAFRVLPDILNGNPEKAMQTLHTNTEK